MASARRIEANRRNLTKRRGLTEAGRERLRRAALRNKPWLRSTGPRTREGKARSRMNARKDGEYDARNRAELAWILATTRTMRLAFCLGRGPAYLLWQSEHWLPEVLNTDTATAWLRGHRVLKLIGEALVRHHASVGGIESEN